MVTFYVSNEYVTADLSPEDESWSWDMANRRQSDSVNRGLPDKYGAAGNGQRGLELHYQGARGEIAVASYLGLPVCNEVGVFSSRADVGDHVDVRTRKESWHDLIVRRADPDDRYMVLCIGLPAGHTPLLVVGWIPVVEARKPEFWNDHGGYGGAWFVPQEALHRFTSL